MKKISILALSVLLSACASETYISDVTTESYREDYRTSSQSITTSETTEVVQESSQDFARKPVSTPEKNYARLTPKNQVKPIEIVPPSRKQASLQRFGYTIQVVAVGSSEKVSQFANKLPQSGQPIWENYKIVNGTKWYSVLYGDYATKAEAKRAISSLPEHFRQLSPFVKSIDSIKSSAYPNLKKIN
ncbi:SPOR domain-containing protein [Vibrio sagamiensis]|uniref:Cytochrome c biogenesis protein CcdA n=1 Tax=Vibrio sagamiensis NBRC 104589 TaxID=1219064 RepID=A0A511QGI3_9VIBR|nr:SPOR domain-containing protein [Vibrio sagamiensis]PNQ64232.1 cytochrome C biogenesis protein CcdA [Vibrio agarivorans]GEM76413.1 cytochrome c biogenesis protein CcdA [Vibrio sagamiensis NBRC 104589]